MKQIYFLLYILYSTLAFTQSTSTFQTVNSKWCFGKKGYLDFMTAPPTVDSSAVTHMGARPVSVADADGNLLFYSDGGRVWNKQHMIMANGNFTPDSSGAYNAVVIKQPCSSTIYYIFCIKQNTGSGNGNTMLCYHTIDMSLAAGMGSVTAYNIPLTSGNFGEPLHATKHANGIDYWIMIHETETNNFRAYLFTPVGISATPVISSVGSIFASYTNNGGHGNLKFSPTGQKIGVTVLSSSVSVGIAGIIELLDFDNGTGIVSNPLTLATDWGPYSCEFSADGTKFYSCGTLFTNRLTQWDLSGGGASAVLSSSVVLYNGASQGYVNFGAMQLAPNGKIYISGIPTTFNGATDNYSLSVINNPNTAGLACNYSHLTQAISLNTSYYGFGSGDFSYRIPNMLSLPCASNFNLSSNNVTTCYQAATGNVSAINFAGCPRFKWSNGINTYTTQQVSTLSAGTWSVKVADDMGCYTQRVFTVSELPPPSTTPSITSNGNIAICAGDTITLSASGANSYLWSNGAQTQSITVAPTQNSTYYVTITDANGCLVNSTPITVSVSAVPALSISGSTIYCSAQIVTLTASGAYNYYWQWGGAHAHASSPQIVLKQGVTTQYTLTGTNEYGCKSVEVVTVTIGCVGSDELEVRSDEMRVYPNPVNEILNVGLEMINKKAVEIFVYDVLGREVIHNSTFNIHHSIDVRGLKSGMYFLKIGNQTQKFVKE
ncbi:MAG: T9SS type A sorting domain-containing protein [Bacteroidetes bacterium]|nr:T9SS type A sorting domain-containing protein [Bacteroidota bacterium]